MQGIGQLTLSCTTDEDDEEQLLAELGDFLWLRLSFPSGSGLLLPLSCLGRFRAFCTPIVSAQFKEKVEKQNMGDKEMEKKGRQTRIRGKKKEKKG